MSAMRSGLIAALLAAAICGSGVRCFEARLSGGRKADDGELHRPLDALLDAYVRDGLVSYQALKQARGTLDRYVTSLDVAPAVYDAWSRDAQLAFWIDAYNAFVLQTVVDHYPIRGRAAAYPPDSIRQIPGAFDRRVFRAAGRRVTLDAIEHTILPQFGDPRAYLVLGRGAVGSGRLRSEAYVGARLEAQLAEMTREFVRTDRHVTVDAAADELQVSAIFGWHEGAFVAAYAERLQGFARRAPIERAVLALVLPAVFASERAWLERDTFRLRYKAFDWRLNDRSP
jgi:hypothetical protein